MSTLTIRMPDEDLAFLEAYAKSQGTSAELFLARQAHQLREQLLRKLRPEVVAVTGIVHQDATHTGHLDYLERKHQ